LTLDLTPAQLSHAATILAAWLACSAHDLTIEPAAGGRSAPVFRVQLENQTCYLRLSETPTASLGPEALAHEVLLSYGARVPAVIGYEPILVAAGADLARMNQAPVDGFGWIRRDDPLPSRLSGIFPTWHEFAADLTAHSLDPWFEPPAIARITELAHIPPADPHYANLAHGDFDPSHIFSLNGRYTGIIDLGEIRGAEPTFDFGHLALHASNALPAILQGYTTITPLPPDLPQQITASALHIGWFRLTQSSAATNPPYATHLVQSMTRLAHALGR
jgi:hypothetical protein